MAEHAMERNTEYEPCYIDRTDIPQVGKIAKALAAAQLEMSNPAFDKQNPHFKSKFASLAAVRNAVIPVLAKHGIAVTQGISTSGNGVACYTVLWHESGGSMHFGPLVMPATKPDAQGFGSAATYARRYALMAVAGVVGDEDDDANEAIGKPAPATALKPGIGVHSPLGEVAVTPEAQAYADAFKTAATPDEVWQVHQDAHNEGEEVYRAVWSLLDSKTRSSIKRIIEQRKAA
jgi:hypothetical protein